MPELIAKRTLVKSPPELWEELSEVERLAKHLGAFGEITITKLEPEHTVAWEGERASGTVSIEPSGWGTRVTLQAELPGEAAPEAEAEPQPEPDEPEAADDEPEAAEAAAPERAAPETPAEPTPEAVTEPEPEEQEPVAIAPERRRRGFWAWLFRPRRGEMHEPAAELEPVSAEPEPVAAEPEPVAAEPEPVAAEPEPEACAPEPEPEACAPEPDSSDRDPDAPLDPERARLVLDEALDALGAAHHRPFSRG